MVKRCITQESEICSDDSNAEISDKKNCFFYGPL